jgi:hypothetical protein
MSCQKAVVLYRFLNIPVSEIIALIPHAAWLLEEYAIWSLLSTSVKAPKR